MFVAKIHNNSLGECIKVNSYDEGVKEIKKMYEDQFNMPLTSEQANELENAYELIIDDDSDNIYTFSIGVSG